MASKTISYLRIPGERTIALNESFLEKLDECPVAGLSTKIRKALKIAAQHNVGLLFDLDLDTSVISYVPIDTTMEARLVEDEAIALAAELNHIFQNNPNFYKWSVKLGRGCTVYSYRNAKTGDAEFVTLVIGSNGQYKTSYDPVRNEFFPPVPRLSTKPLAKIYPQILDELQNMYRKVRGGIEKMRAEEADKIDGGKTKSGSVSE